MLEKVFVTLNIYQFVVKELKLMVELFEVIKELLWVLVRVKLVLKRHKINLSIIKY